MKTRCSVLLTHVATISIRNWTDSSPIHDNLPDIHDSAQMSLLSSWLLSKTFLVYY